MVTALMGNFVLLLNILQLFCPMFCLHFKLDSFFNCNVQSCSIAMFKGDIITFVYLTYCLCGTLLTVPLQIVQAMVRARLF